MDRELSHRVETKRSSAPIAQRSLGTWHVKAEIAGSKGVGSASSDVAWLSLPRQIPIPAMGTTASFPWRSPASEPRNDATPGRYRSRPRTLTPEHAATIRALAGTRSLRSLAAEFGVSHETVRTAVRRADGAAPTLGDPTGYSPAELGSAPASG